MKLTFPASLLVGATALLFGGFFIPNMFSTNQSLAQGIVNPWIEVAQPPVSNTELGVRRELKSGDMIYAGNIIEVGASGLAVIHFPDGSIARIDSGTKLALADAMYDAESERLVVKMNLIGGRVWSKILALVTSDSAWEVQTTNAVATVRGTAFDMEYKNRKSKILGIEHTVSVSAKNLSAGQPIPEVRVPVTENKLVVIGDDEIGQMPQAQDAPAEIFQDPWIGRGLEADKAIDQKLTALREGGLGESAVRAKFREEAAKELFSTLEEDKASLRLAVFDAFFNPKNEVLDSKGNNSLLNLALLDESFRRENTDIFNSEKSNTAAKRDKNNSSSNLTANLFDILFGRTAENSETAASALDESQTSESQLSADAPENSGSAAETTDAIIKNDDSISGTDTPAETSSDSSDGGSLADGSSGGFVAGSTGGGFGGGAAGFGGGEVTNRAPVAESQAVTLLEDGQIGLALAASDADNNSLTYMITGNPTHGSLSALSGNQVTYTPNPNFFGADSFTFKANDGKLDSNETTVSIIMSSVNDAPIALAQSITLNEDASTTIALSGTDDDGDGLSYLIVASTTNGTLTVSSSTQITYTPNANFFGTDSFAFKVNDGLADSATSTVSISILPLNDSPVAESASVSVNEDDSLTITLLATDPDSSALTYAIVASSTNGTVTTPVSNQLTYMPNLNFNGTDSFTFKASDGTLESNVATVTISVLPVNDAPTADGQSVSVSKNNSLTISLSGSDVEGSALTYLIETNPQSGVLGAVSGNQVTYTPANGFTGSDSFVFKTNDGELNSATATVTIAVIHAGDDEEDDGDKEDENEDHQGDHDDDDHHHRYHDNHGDHDGD